jgi:hypothetical protein
MERRLIYAIMQIAQGDCGSVKAAILGLPDPSFPHPAFFLLNEVLMEKCPHCGSNKLYHRKGPIGPHEGEVVCARCQRHVRWLAKAKNEEKLKKRPNGTPSPADLGIDHCQICLRPRHWLGDYETLETHHIDDEPTNIERINLLVVCTACHKWINHARLYVNTHLKKFYDKAFLYETMKRKLQEKNLTPDEYDREILLIAELLEV